MFCVPLVLHTCNAAIVKVAANSSLRTRPSSAIHPLPHHSHKNSPLKRGKGGGRLGRVAHIPKADAVTQEGGQGDEAGEPEEHGESLGGEDAELVGGGGEAPGSEDEVEQGEQGPDGGKDEEVDLRGRVAVPIAGPPC